MFGHDHFNFHFTGALNDGVKVFNFKPKQNAVPIRSVIRVPDLPVVMLYLETVELQDEFAIPY